MTVTITINDRATFEVTGTRREYTDEGFLRVPGRVARTGVQEYLASELGLADRAPNDIIRVYRPPEEVFSDESLASYAGTDVTNDHPAGLVDADTFKQVTVGTVRTAGSQDGDHVVADLVIKDKAAISLVESGKVQLSAGYTAVYDDEVPEGADYHFIQRNIKINHVALVDRARAGAQARIFDNDGKTGAITMPKLVTLDNGRTVELADESTAALVADSLARLEKTATDAQAAADTATANLDTVTAERDTLKAQVKDLEAKTSKDAIAEQVAAVATVKDSAVLLAGKDFTCDSVDPTEIKRAALAKIRPGTAWADKNATYVEASFDAEMERKEAEDEDEDGDDKDTTDSQRAQLARDAAMKQTGKTNHRQAAMDSVSGAWKGKQGE